MLQQRRRKVLGLVRIPRPTSWSLADPLVEEVEANREKGRMGEGRRGEEEEEEEVVVLWLEWDILMRKGRLVPVQHNTEVAREKLLRSPVSTSSSSSSSSSNSNSRSNNKISFTFSNKIRKKKLHVSAIYYILYKEGFVFCLWTIIILFFHFFSLFPFSNR